MFYLILGHKDRMTCIIVEGYLQECILYCSLMLGETSLRQTRNRFADEETMERKGDLTKETDGDYKPILLSLRISPLTRKHQKTQSLFLFGLSYEND